MPVIGTVLDFYIAGENRSLAMFEGSYTDGIVRTWNPGPDNTIYYYYQYWDRAHYPSVEDMEPIYPDCRIQLGLSYWIMTSPRIQLQTVSLMKSFLCLKTGLMTKQFFAGKILRYPIIQ